MTAVELFGLGINFPGVEVFSNVTVKIEEGEFAAVVGPNGSGKSTLLKLICKILQPKQGKIEIFGTSIENFKNWNNVSYIAQSTAQQNRKFPVLVSEVVAMGLVSNKAFSFPWFSEKEKRKIASALEAVGMQGYETNFFGSLSGGQKQKVLLARSLASESKLLLLDEPTSGIDADAKQEIYGFLQELNKKSNNTIIMVSHDMELAAKAADKVLCLEKGGICYWGDAQEMMLHRHKGGYYFNCAGEHNGHLCL